MLPGSVSRLAGGLFTSVRRLSESLNSTEKIRVNVVGNRDAHTDNDLNAWQTSPHILGSSGLHSLSKELYRRLDRESPDIVHSQFIWSYASLATIRFTKRNPNCRHLISPRGMLDPWAVRNSRWKKKFAGLAFENKHLRSAACIHALCSNEAVAIRDYGLRNPICIIPNGIDLPKHDKAQSEVCPRPYKQLIYVGRIHPKKGLRELIQAWRLARTSLVGWHLVIAGWDDGGHLHSLRSLTNDLGEDHNITFPGPLYGKIKSQTLENADAFILPSFSEGLPMSILEAWSYGLPVLMTSECNLPKGFTSNSAIEIRNSPELLAADLIEFAGLSESQRHRIGANGRRLVEADFQWSTISDQMSDVYRWLTGRGDAPNCVIFD